MLRGSNKLNGYRMAAESGDIGRVDDFFFDDEVWIIRYLVLDTRNWIPERKVLRSLQWVGSQISWDERKVSATLTKEHIRDSPAFYPAAPVNREYEARLYDYYGRPGYWEKSERSDAKSSVCSE